MSTLPEPEKNAIFFYGHTPPKDGSIGPHIFSQWWHASFDLNSTVFQTAEHYMMYSKALAFGDRSVANEVLKYYDPEPVKQLGRLIKNFDEDLWKRVRYQIVCRGTYEKFRQNRQLADYLVSTGDAPIFEASPRDAIWGIGLSVDRARPLFQVDPVVVATSGLNLLGKALMAAREMLRSR